MQKKKKSAASSSAPPKNPFVRKLRERKIIETLAAFIGGGWLILEFVHWILVDHYRWPERLIDLTFITLVGALLCSLTWRWFRVPGMKRGRFKPEYILIPVFALVTLVLDIQVLKNLTNHESGHDMPSAESDIPKNSIAVLPFRNLSPDSGGILLHEGMTDTLIAKLSKLNDLSVTSRTSVMRYRDEETDIKTIGRELNVASVLEGSVQREGEALRVSVRLFSTEDGFQMWSQTYDKALDSIFVIQDEIARSVIDSLKITIARTESETLDRHETESLEAYDLYLKGRSLWNYRTEPALERAVDYFKRAIEQDPDYAPAYSGIADSFVALANFSVLSPEEGYPTAREWARKALQIDNSLAEAHASIALIKFFYEWDWEGAERKFQKALEVNPSYAFGYQTYALFLAAQGRSEEARHNVDTARSLDPLSRPARAASGVIAYMARDFGLARAELEDLVRMAPDFPLGYLYLAQVDLQAGNTASAERNLRRALAGAESDSRIRSWLGYALFMSGDQAKKTEAIKVLEELEKVAESKYLDPVSIALIYLGSEDVERAYEWLNKGLDVRSFWMVWLLADPVFDRLRQEGRFRDLLGAMGRRSASEKHAVMPNGDSP